MCVSVCLHRYAYVVIQTFSIVDFVFNCEFVGIRAFSMLLFFLLK